MVAEYTFKTNLSMEEIKDNFKYIDFFEGVKSGLEEALAFEKGQAAADTFARKSSLPQINVSELRHSLSLTQKAFAALLGVSTSFKKIRYGFIVNRIVKICDAKSKKGDFPLC